MNENLINAYLDTVCSHIRWQEVHSQIRHELQSHIVDSAHARMAEGMNEKEALEWAIEQMGAAEEVGPSAP